MFKWILKQQILDFLLTALLKMWGAESINTDHMITSLSAKTAFQHLPMTPIPYT